jgi:hypothetical protein
MAKFSTELTDLFTKHKSIKIADLNELFGEKSFAIAFILLMMTAALPLPTGGITHLFEIITILLALEMVAGRRRIWLPKRWEHKAIHSPTPHKGLGKIVGVVEFFERFSRRRGHFVAQHHIFVRLVGLIVIVLTVFAFIAPPFSGLDTLPAMGIVILSLGLMLDDLLLVVVGVVIGATGVLVVVGLSTAIIEGFKSYCTHVKQLICGK